MLYINVKIYLEEKRGRHKKFTDPSTTHLYLHKNCSSHILKYLLHNYKEKSFTSHHIFFNTFIHHHTLLLNICGAANTG